MLGAGHRLGVGVSSLRARAPPRVSSAAPSTEARLRPGRQGVQRIYRLTSEKAQLGVYEYLESIGVPRVNALQVQSKAGEWFEYENAKRGGRRMRRSACARWRRLLISCRNGA